MRSHSVVNARTMVITLCALWLAVGFLVHPAQADQWDKKTILTVHQPIQVKETFLPAGEYVLKLLNSNSDRHIVQIFNGDQSHLIDTVLAIPNYRLQPTGESQFMFYETPPGTAKAMRAWFYPGDNYGQEFPYPKRLARLEPLARTSIPAPEPSAPTAQPETQAPPPAEPQPTTQPQAATPEPEHEQKPVETAQAAPPPAPPPQESSANREQQPPPILPKTASPYPLIGLFGVLSVGLYGLLRR